MSGSYNVRMRKLRLVGDDMKEAELGLVQYLISDYESKQELESLKRVLQG